MCGHITEIISVSYTHLDVYKRQVLTGAVFVGVILYGGWRLSHRTAQAQEEIVAEETKYIADRPDFSVELLDYNEYSRPGTALEKVNGIVVHYTACLLYTSSMC